jgi:hypothetical protein
MKTEMKRVMDQVGILAFKKDFTKEDFKIVKMLIEDGMVIEMKFGQGRATQYFLSKKGTMIAELAK